MTQIKSFAALSALFIFFVACDKDEDEIDNNTGLTSSIYYQEFNVDTTNYANDTVYYDVDNDGVFDIQVTRYIEIDGSDVQYGGQFKWVNDSMNFCFMINTPSTFMIAPGDEINGTGDQLEWQPIINYAGSTGIFNENHYWADGIFTRYFGFEYISAQGPLYGWFRFKHFELAEMAINTNPNESILVGQKE